MDPRVNNITGYIYEVEKNLLFLEASKVKDGTIVELGSYLGKSTAALADGAGPGTKIDAVDAWDNRAMDGCPKVTYEQFIKNIEPWKDKITAHRTNTSSLAKDFIAGVDLLFIDADHSYEGCKADLEAWYPLVNEGGVILMHDYTEKGCGVKKAADEFFAKVKGSKSHIIGSILVVKV